MRDAITLGLVSLVLSVSLAAPVLAGPQEDAGKAYERGDYAIAVRLFRPLADQGDSTAQSTLGLMYEKGRGVPQDYAEAVNWFRKAADVGVPDAQYNLGVLYAEGRGVPQDSVQAHKWLTLAAERFPASDSEGRVAAMQGRDLVAAKLTPEQIAEAQKLARDWKPKGGK